MKRSSILSPGSSMTSERTFLAPPGAAAVFFRYDQTLNRLGKPLDKPVVFFFASEGRTRPQPGIPSSSDVVSAVRPQLGCSNYGEKKASSSLIPTIHPPYGPHYLFMRMKGPDHGR